MFDRSARYHHKCPECGVEFTSDYRSDLCDWCTYVLTFKTVAAVVTWPFRFGAGLVRRKKKEE